MHNALRIMPLLILAAAANAAAPAQAPEIIAPYVISIAGPAVHIRNPTDRYLQLTLHIDGSNFVSEFPCDVRVYLGGGGEHTLRVSAKDKTLPANYRVSVTEFSAKTTEQLISEHRGKALPAAQPATADALAKMQVLRCESK